MSLTPALEKLYQLDKQHLESTELPIITVSASSREDLKGVFGLPENETLTDIVFSRAHYSMALAIAIQAWQSKVDAKKAWIIDPTNYVSAQDWNKIVLTETIGKTLARNPLLKRIKDLIDRFGRSKLPILPSITPPLLHLTENIDRPILSLHIAAGNILAAQGKKVLQIITDPHVRGDYLFNADLPNIKYGVFDSKTKTDFLEKAKILGKKVSPEKVIVTGPPIDPRVIKAKRKKNAWRSGPLHVCLATGGLGTNKQEIKKILCQFMPELRKKPSPFRLMLYAGTQKDIFAMARRVAHEKHVQATIIRHSHEANLLKKHSRQKHHHNFYILYHPQIVDANELLVEHAFAWSHAFISKPSGDMAYDAVASGNFLLTLQEWGEWEHNIREFFEQKEVSRPAQVDHIIEQINTLQKTGWVEKAMHKAFVLDDVFAKGAENIIKAVASF